VAGFNVRLGTAEVTFRPVCDFVGCRLIFLPFLTGQPFENRYLQWTSPSLVGDKNQFPVCSVTERGNTDKHHACCCCTSFVVHFLFFVHFVFLVLQNEWRPSFASENNQVETKQFTAKGSVAAAGITVDTSNRVVKQIFDVDNSKVINEISLDFGILSISGIIRPSENVPRRAIVAFKSLDIDFKNGLQLKLDWIFALLAKIRGADAGGWLETTYLDDDVRIGRGNKGTCFILTRDFDAVIP